MSAATPPPDPQENPYAAPTAVGVPVPLSPHSSQWDEIRRQHIGHEVSLRSFGVLILIGSVVLMLLSGSTAYELFIAGYWALDSPLGLIYLGSLVMFLALSLLYLATAFGLRQLNMMGRVGGTLVGLMMLVGFPVGTFLGIYLLYLVWSPKSTMIFSSEYREIRAATPHIRYRTSPAVWAVAIILVALLSFLVVAALAF